MQTFDCASKAGACVVTVQSEDLDGATTTSPLSFDPSVPPVVPTATVAPATRLADHQSVTIKGTGYTPGARVIVLQCATGADVAEIFFGGCDYANSASVTAGFGGKIRLSVSVQRSIAPITGVTSESSLDCAASPSACVLELTDLSASEPTELHLAFDTRVPTSTQSLTLQPGRGLSENQRIGASATGFTPYATVSVVQCSTEVAPRQPRGVRLFEPAERRCRCGRTSGRNDRRAPDHRGLRRAGRLHETRRCLRGGRGRRRAVERRVLAVGRHSAAGSAWTALEPPKRRAVHHSAVPPAVRSSPASRSRPSPSADHPPREADVCPVFAGGAMVLRVCPERAEKERTVLDRQLNKTVKSVEVEPFSRGQMIEIGAWEIGVDGKPSRVASRGEHVEENLETWIEHESACSCAAIWSGYPGSSRFRTGAASTCSASRGDGVWVITELKREGAQTGTVLQALHYFVELSKMTNNELLERIEHHGRLSERLEELRASAGYDGESREREYLPHGRRRRPWGLGGASGGDARQCRADRGRDRREFPAVTCADGRRILLREIDDESDPPVESTSGWSRDGLLRSAESMGVGTESETICHELESPDSDRRCGRTASISTRAEEGRCST